MRNNYASKILDLWASNKPLTPIKAELFLDAVDQIASLFTIGPYYYYIVNFETLEINFVHHGIESVLGIKPEDFSLDTLFDIMHPDDLSRMHQKEETASFFFQNKISPKHLCNYKVMYAMRLQHSDGQYRSILHQTKALHVSEDGKIQSTINVHTDATYLKIPINHQISIIGNGLPSYYSIETQKGLKESNQNLIAILSKREREIINLLSLGETASQIAETLNISVHTVNTHKKNILKKTNSNSTPEVISKCLMQGII